jgi:serine/threonine protein kinase
MGNCCSSAEPIPLNGPYFEIPDKIESKSINIKCFNLITVLGQGSFGKVLLMEKKDTQKIYAIKTIHKQKLYNTKKKRHALMERQVLANVISPFVVKLHYAFQNSEKLYLVLDFMQGGDLYYHLSKYKCFTEEMVRFYAVEVVLALQDLHTCNVLYRDLKPENILMDCQGHVKLADFNLAKNIAENELTSTMCGTPEYISPEILKGSPHGKEVDFWGLGCVIFEMIEGKSPFYASNYKKLFSKIINGSFNFSEKFSAAAMDIVSQLLTVQVKSRLTSVEKIKAHDFFRGIDWELAYMKKLTPPVVPVIEGRNDTRYFNPPLGAEASPRMNWDLYNKEGNSFRGFTYEDPNMTNEIL